MPRSVMTPQQVFNHVAHPELQRSTFDRSHRHATTFNSAVLVPVFWDFAMPGDTLKMTPHMFGRMATPIKPIMDNIYMDIHFWSIPLRLIWSNFKPFMGELAPGVFTQYTLPTTTSTAVTGYTEGSLFDFFRLPTKVPGFTHQNLPLRAYLLTHNEWYRDENLQTPITVPLGDGPDLPSAFPLLSRGLRKDYFMAALPFAQKTGTAVSIPLGLSAPVYGTGKALGLTDGTTNYGLVANPSTALNQQYTGAYGQTLGGFHNTGSAPTAGKDIGVVTSGTSGMYADLSTATAATITQLRESIQIQRFWERDARGGTRYTEKIYSHFGVRSPDARQQRPEFLGGSTTRISINPVAQTQATGASGTTTPQGNLSAYATMSQSGGGFIKSFTEHEIVLGLASVRADQTYQQGLRREWSYSTQFDFPWPVFAHLSEQAVLNKEIYCQGSANPSADASTWGYMPRYDERRYFPSGVSGQFRSNSTTPLDSWLLTFNFASLPALNATTITLPPPMARVLAQGTNGPEFIADFYFDYHYTACLPTFGTPGFMDHF